MFGSDAGEVLYSLDISSPRVLPALRRFRLIDSCECCGIDDGAVQIPINGSVGFGIGDIERIGVVIFESAQVMAFGIAADCTSQFAAATEHHGALRCHWFGVFQHWMMQVRLRALGILQRNGPLNVELRIREIDEGVGLLLLEAPMGVD